MSDSLNPTPDAEQLMLGAIPGKPALGRGPAVDGDYSRHPYHHPAAGWGAAESVASVLARAGEPIEGFRAILVSIVPAWSIRTLETLMAAPHPAAGG
jgi:hypothetical protein